jgi:hypothetical protein
MTCCNCTPRGGNRLFAMSSSSNMKAVPWPFRSIVAVMFDTMMSNWPSRRTNESSNVARTVPVSSCRYRGPSAIQFVTNDRTESVGSTTGPSHRTPAQHRRISDDAQSSPTRQGEVGGSHPPAIKDDIDGKPRVTGCRASDKIETSVGCTAVFSVWHFSVFFDLANRGERLSSATCRLHIRDSVREPFERTAPTVTPPSASEAVKCYVRAYMRPFRKPRRAPWT